MFSRKAQNYCLFRSFLGNFKSKTAKWGGRGGGKSPLPSPNFNVQYFQPFDIFLTKMIARGLACGSCALQKRRMLHPIFLYPHYRTIALSISTLLHYSTFYIHTIARNSFARKNVNGDWKFINIQSWIQSIPSRI